MYKKQTLSLFTTVSAVALAMGTIPANAQDASDEVTVLERIIVEGDKSGRTEDEIAPSIVIITEDVIQNPSNSTISQLINSVPNVIADEDATIPTIRGVSSNVNTNQVFGSGVLPRVPVLVDNVAGPVAQSKGYLSNSAWDVGVVEVAKGPQPTSTGRNAFSGAIRIFTNDPVFDNEYAWRVGFSSLTDEYNTAFMINQQLIEDELAIRITGELRDGDTLVQVNDPRIILYDPNELRYENLRGKVRYAPAEIEGLDLQFTYDYASTRDEYAPVIEFGNQPDQLFINNSLGFGGYDITETERYIGEASYEFSENLELFLRGSQLSSNLENPFPGTIIPGFRPFGAVLFSTEETEYEGYLQFNDLGLVSKGVFGVVHTDSSDVVGSNTNFAALVGQSPFLIDVDGEATTTGIYGEVELDLGEISELAGVTLIAGARYEMDDRSRSVLADNSLQSNRRFEENIFLPKLGVKYNPTSDFEVGYTYSEAYRPGGVEVDLVSGFVFPIGVQNVLGVAEFTKETIQNHEIHLKSSLMDGQLNFGATAFYYIYEDAQVSGASAVPSAFPGFFLTGNIPEAIGQGVELSVDYQNDMGLSMNASVGWLDTEITNAGPVAAAFQGASLPNAPEFSAAFGINYQHSDGWNVGATVRFVDDMVNRLGVTPIDSYTVVDIAAGFDFEGLNGSDMRLDLSVNNVFDEAYLVENADLRDIVGRPREGRITLTSRL